MSLVKDGKIRSYDQKVKRDKYEKNYERIFGKWTPTYDSNGRLKSYDRSYSTLDDSESSISKMIRDKVMVRMIRDGKASDRGLKREAEQIERENSIRPQRLFYERKQKELEAMKLELRRSQR